ncbi:MAG: ribose-5-phosphate isomerase RpiA [Euryarchaeota archaeon]|nr:ribose-5-phosphate isomerase RpiA [Euryarchaeota archaeon]
MRATGSDPTTLKRLAGETAAEEVHDGDVVGLGTGSTVEWTLKALGRKVAEGMSLLGIPTSLRSESLAKELGIPLTSLEEHPVLDVTIDGADEVDRAFDLVKGGGGALTREKIVAAASKREVIVVDPSKLVERLADRFPLPVEVVPMAVPTVRRTIADMGAEVVVRKADDGTDMRTDNGFAILDCRFPGGIGDKRYVEQEINNIPGVLENGLFLDMTDRIVVGTEDGPVRLDTGQWLGDRPVH